ncbi:ABC transporter substrate-binding protein [Sphaerisporangium dianthi]|uniref:ABC transporter substrate-binding protein n=1 Tax=Sphaerisporangium dianthi TaxID=1436120 RepID=A0ABV9CH27_9ACTN
MRPVRTALAGALLGALTLAACGQSGSTTADAPPATPATTAASSQAAAFPVTVQAGNGAVTVPAKPTQIVSLSPTATESLFAIGAGPQVIAVDDQSTYPADAPKTDLSGFKPNAEAIIAKKPDLVVLANDTGGVVAALAKVGIPVLLEPAATKLEESYDEIADLGAATGNKDKADQVTADMKRQIEQFAASAPKDAKLSYFHELDNTPYSVTSSTFIGQIYAMFGLTNIADEAPDAAGGYPKLSTEFVAKADPDLIFLADTKCCGQSKETLAKRPGWGGLSAIKKDQVFPIDDDIASRWGPRVVDLAKAIDEAVKKAAG